MLLGQSKGGTLIYAMLGRIGLNALPRETLKNIGQKPLGTLPDLDRVIAVNSPLTQGFWAPAAGHSEWDQAITGLGLSLIRRVQQSVDLASVWNVDDVVGSPPSRGVRDIRYARGSVLDFIIGRIPFDGGEHSEPWEQPCVVRPVARLAATGSWGGVQC